MSYVLPCPKCKTGLRYKKAPSLPQRAPCPRCGHLLVIPAGPPTAAPVERHPGKPAFVPDEQSIVTPTAVPRPAPPAKEAPRERPADPYHARGEDLRGNAHPDYGPARRDHDELRRERDRAFGDDRPRPRRSGGGKGLIIGLTIGGVVLLLVGVGVVLFFVLGGNPLVGRWRPAEFGREDVVIEFTRGGEMIVRAGGIDVERARYRVTGANTLEIEEEGAGFGFGGFGGGFEGPADFGPAGRRQVGYFRFEGGDLILSDRPGMGGPRLRRI